MKLSLPAFFICVAVMSTHPGVCVPEDEPVLPTPASVAGIYGMDLDATVRAGLKEIARRAGKDVAALPESQVDAVHIQTRQQMDTIALMAFLDPSGSYEFTVSSLVAGFEPKDSPRPRRGRWSASDEAVSFVEADPKGGEEPLRYLTADRRGDLLVLLLPGQPIPMFLRRAATSVHGGWRFDKESSASESAPLHLPPEKRQEIVEEMIEGMNFVRYELDLDLDGTFRGRKVAPAGHEGHRWLGRWTRAGQTVTITYEFHNGRPVEAQPKLPYKLRWLDGKLALVWKDRQEIPGSFERWSAGTHVFVRR